MSNINSPYINTEYHTRVDLVPYQMNNDVYKNLKINLKKDIEKKCNKYGYVVKVFKITDYSHGIIEPENFLASAIYNVKFSCRMCIPSIKTKLICVISNTNKALIVAENGPIISVITTKNVNYTNFIVDNNGILNHKKKDGTSQQLKSKDIIKITVIATKFNKGDNNIKIFGFLEDIASKEEKEMYYSDLHYKENIETDDKDEYIEQNSDQSENEDEFDIVDENEEFI